MFEQKILNLATNTSQYVDFFKVVEKRIGLVEFYTNADDFINAIYSTENNHPNLDSALIIAFVECPLLSEVYSDITSKINSPNIIFIPYMDKHANLSHNKDNIFDFINVGIQSSSLDFAKADLDENSYDDFFKKLEREINNKRKIIFLQNEVKEFYEIGKALSSEKDTVKLLDMIIESSIKMTSSDAATIFLVVDKETQKWSSITDGIYDNKLRKFVIAKNKSIDILDLKASVSPITRNSISGYSIITGNSFRIDNAYEIDKESEYKHDATFDQNTGYRTKSILSIPMKDHNNNVMGVIQLINKKKNKDEILDYKEEDTLDNIIEYDYIDEMIMNSMAGQAAVALENNLLYRDMSCLLEDYKDQNTQLKTLSKEVIKAHEEERKRIARDIHDGPAQAVVNLSLKLELAKKFIEIGNHENAISEIENLNNTARNATKEIRTIIYDLKPSNLDEGLFIALQSHISTYEADTGIDIILNTSGDDSVLEYYIISSLFRIVQEALSNIKKHANATEVVIEIDVTDNIFKIVISDNGKGFDTSKLKDKETRTVQGGFGIEGIRERLELIKGKLDITSEIDNGTKLVIEVPLKYSVCEV